MFSHCRNAPPILLALPILSVLGCSSGPTSTFPEPDLRLAADSPELSPRRYLPPVAGTIYPHSRVSLPEILTALRTFGAVTHQLSDGGAVVRIPGRSALRLFCDSTATVTTVVFDLSSQGDSPEAEWKAWIEILSKVGIADQVLTANPYRAAEVAALRIAGLPSPSSPTSSPWKTTSLSDLSCFHVAPNAILGLPDYHGDREIRRVAVELLQDSATEWMAIEMPERLQPGIQIYLHAPENSNAYQNARAELLDYLNSIAFWDNNDNDGTRTVEMELLTLARRLGKQIVAIDANESYSGAFDIEDPVTALTRNYVWSKNLPASGRGVLFGGEHHFQRPDGGSVFDFVARNGSGRALVLLERNAL